MKYLGCTQELTRDDELPGQCAAWIKPIMQSGASFCNFRHDFTADSLIESHSLLPHLYSDDTQVYSSCSPAAVDVLSVTISECSADVASWMKSNRLQLNSDKTEVMWCTTDRRQHQLPTLPLCRSMECLLARCRLSIYIDADLVMQTHVQKTTSRCFAVLRQLRQIRRYVSTNTFQALVVALVVTRLDYGNAVLTGLPVYLSRCLQSVLNAAAQLIFGLRRSDHVSDALISLHWCAFRSASSLKRPYLRTKVLHGCAPSYTLVHSSVWPTHRLRHRVDELFAPPTLAALSSHSPTGPPLATEPFLLLVPRSGTVCHRRSHQRNHWSDCRTPFADV